MRCRICSKLLDRVLCDLGSQPLSNAFLTRQGLEQSEMTYPLRVYVCDECNFAQLPAHAAPETIFGSSYPYFSGYSKLWLQHCQKFVETAKRWLKSPEDQVVEIASNDGTLLKTFQERGYQNVIGIEPARVVREAAQADGVPTIGAFFGMDLMEQRGSVRHSLGASARLVVANNVLAHVPDLHDFLSALKALLHPEGVATIEFPWAVNLISRCQFDTIYHEHFSYLTLGAVKHALQMHDLSIMEAEELPIHGGSLRVVCAHSAFVHAEEDRRRFDDVVLAQGRIRELLHAERNLFDRDFQASVDQICIKLIAWLHEHRNQVAGFGAAAKGNTLLNYCGIRPSVLPFIVDDNPHKQGLYTPGMHIPVEPVEALLRSSVSHVLILPWNVSADARDRLRPLAEQATLVRPDLSVVTW